ncbi:MAG TPA: hypothetical protein VF721_05230 [Pyrinomonadaceae bacterium]
MEIAPDKKHFIAWLFIAACLLSGCGISKKISERINENSFKDKARAQFKEDFPDYEVSFVAIRHVNQRVRAAMIFYHKPDVKGTFITDWTYRDNDENPNNLTGDWQLVEKGGERQLAVREN